MFREEAIEAKRHRLLGKVVVIQPESLYVISLAIVITFILLVIFLSNASYSRKVTVKGYLTPEKGVVKVYAQRSGTVEEFYVKAGDTVTSGDKIVRIRNSQSLSTGIELSVALEKELTVQISALEKELSAIRQLYDNDKLRIASQLSQLKRSLNAIQMAKKTSKHKLALKERQLNNNEKLNAKGYLSDSHMDVVKEEYLSTLESYERLELELATILVDVSVLESERRSLPEQTILKEVQIQREISKLHTQIIELGNQFEYIKKASESGVVTTIHPIIGGRASANTPLLSIIPEDSPFEIELLLPTRAAGFVQVGDKVKIRFDAFPYQKFGVRSGYVLNIDKALILPSDKILPITIDEAMYRVRAKLEDQSIDAYGASFPLKVGMSASADIILEERTLLEWLLDPIYALKGRLG